MPRWRWCGSQSLPSRGCARHAQAHSVFTQHPTALGRQQAGSHLLYNTRSGSPEARRCVLGQRGSCLSRYVRPLDTHLLMGMARGLPIIYVLKWARKLKERSDYGWFLRDDILTILTDTTLETHTEGNFLETVVVWFGDGYHGHDNKSVFTEHVTCARHHRRCVTDATLQIPQHHRVTSHSGCQE